MNPVIGLDISKQESHGQVFLERGKPYKGTFHFEHTREGLAKLLHIVQDVELAAKQRPLLILEATGHYQSPVVQFLEEHHYLYIVINPLISNRLRKSNLRKVKTDAADAYLLGEMYYKEEFEPFKKRGVQLLNLRYLTRQFESLSKMCVQIKLQFQAVLDQVFPAYKGVFGAMYSSISLRFLNEYPTSYSVLQTDEETLNAKMKELLSTRRGRSDDWISERVKRLLDAAKQNPFEQTMYASHLVNLRVLITLILQYQEHLAELEQNIDALAEEIEEYDLIQSIPGIGHKIAATILSEIGEIDRFDHPKKLVAFAGIDPSVFASGKFTATRNRITKRGSRQLRYALVMAVQCGLIRSRNIRIKAFYDRKRAEGKPHKVALVACANKLIHWIHAILKNKKTFRPT
ncbi:IS110 family transposase [Paenibacillus sp. N3/727]|uniref:IS110 family transposase n=1 Tax=Paenibacillus sp. N3/727 TaxID=2925845 RepID=UPI001F52B674|nr:IS110 family transposase [Paenibacillus sp. N3/727]UNK21301.1 IS110 family transposase [Paenibacillus sp. N3/727]UNK21314.1 IS110 family transposase [Paenibacillus sp. N3/727]